METLGLWLIKWVLAVFATYRAARMLALEEGPASLFDRYRDAAAALFGADSSVTRGVNCPYCTGWWLALAGALYVWNGVNLFEGLILWLAVAGGAAYLQATEGEP